MESQEAYEKARRRVEAKIGFYIHLAVYVGVNLLLLIINLATSPRYLWFKWPLLGWGIGLLFHGIGISLHSRGFALKEKMIEREMRKEVNREMK
jgi:2TM domain